MLKDKYTFKAGYNDWGVFCAFLKDWLADSAKFRPKNLTQTAGLLNVSVLKDFNIRLDRKLCQYKSTVSFTIKQSEGLAIYIAYRHGTFPKFDIITQIVNTIDRQI